MECKTVLLTGGIGSGKSAVSEYLRTKGIAVYDSDSRTKMLYDSDRELVAHLEDALGVSLAKEDGSMDRKILAGKIFSSEEALGKLEAIVHPAVLKDFLGWKASVSEDGREFVVMESAIALDRPFFDEYYDAVVIVDAPLELRVDRASKRDACPREEILKRAAAQSFDLTKADAVIYNDKDFAALKERTDIAFNMLYLQSGMKEPEEKK